MHRVLQLKVCALRLCVFDLSRLFRPLDEVVVLTQVSFHPSRKTVAMFLNLPTETAEAGILPPERGPFPPPERDTPPAEEAQNEEPAVKVDRPSPAPAPVGFGWVMG